jgi:hypothetical protein
MAEKSKLKIAYHIKKEEGRDKPFFNRIGKAFNNKDGSMNLLLDYIPLPVVNKDGTVEQLTINIRDYVPKEKTDSDSFSE